MTLVDVFHSRRSSEVQHDTWGHLKPQPKTTYPATLLIAVSIYGENVLLDWVIGDLPGSPWLHEHLMQMLEEINEDPGVYRYTGTYRMLVSGAPKWTGDIALVMEALT